MTGDADQRIKVVLALLGIAVLVFTWAVRRALRKREPAPIETLARLERRTTQVLVVLAGLGVLNYFGFNATRRTLGEAVKNLYAEDKFDGYDLVHYYLNSKYFEELGYTHLYEACVIADLERKDNFRRWGFQRMRDLDSSAQIPIAATRRRAEEIKALFSKTRWRTFKHDFRFIQRAIPRRMQLEMINDHGYNGTPFLQAVAGLVTHDLPVEHLKLLCHSETLLVLLMLWLVQRTYGTRITAIAVLWYAIDFSARWPGVSFGIFRLDWFVALVVACCLMKRAEPPEGERASRRHVALQLAVGALVAYAAMQRVFPVVWLFGLGARAVWLLVNQRRIDRLFVTVMAGFLVSTAIFAGIAYRVVGRDNVEEFVEDMEEHLRPENLSQQRMGFAIALAYRGEHGRGFAHSGDRKKKFELVGKLTRVRFAGAVLALFLLGMTLRPRSDPEVGARTDGDDAMMLGFLPFYFLMIASHYYWIDRMTMVLHHGKHEERGGHVAGLAALFAIDVMSNVIDTATHWRYFLTGTASVALGLYCAWIIGTRLYRTYAPRRAPATAAST